MVGFPDGPPCALLRGSRRVWLRVQKEELLAKLRRETVHGYECELPHLQGALTPSRACRDDSASSLLGCVTYFYLDVPPNLLDRGMPRGRAAQVPR